MPDTALVTGATGGLGGAVVEALEQAGWATAALGSGDADLTSAQDAERAIGSIEGLAAVVHLAGGFSSGPKVHETSPADFARMVELNLFTTFNVARAAVPVLLERGGGPFVAVSAKAVERPFPGAAAYVCAKAAVLAFVRCLAADYAGAGVRANVLLPGTIDTPANREAMPDADTSKWVPPEQIARVIRFLCSEDSKPTSGAAVPVYGRA